MGYLVMKIYINEITSSQTVLLVLSKQKCFFKMLCFDNVNEFFNVQHFSDSSVELDSDLFILNSGIFEIKQWNLKKTIQLISD